MTSYSNFESFEGTVSGTATITFTRKPRRVIITNDHASNNLSFKFNSGETYATLKPTETITLNMAHTQILLSGTSVPYRIWGIG